MGYRFEFDANHRVFRASFHGRIDDDEMTRYDAHVRQVLAKIHLRAAIVDASAVTKFDVSAATIRFIAASEAEISDQAIPIVMIAPAAHIYGMARMFQILIQASAYSQKACSISNYKRHCVQTYQPPKVVVAKRRELQMS